MRILTRLALGMVCLFLFSPVSLASCEKEMAIFGRIARAGFPETRAIPVFGKKNTSHWQKWQSIKGERSWPFGDLSKEEMKKIQEVANGIDRPILVVGSAADGTRRGKKSSLPIGKGPNSKSDIDYVLLPDPSVNYHSGGFTKWLRRLPDADVQGHEIMRHHIEKGGQLVEGVLIMRPRSNRPRILFLPQAPDTDPKPLYFVPGQELPKLF